MTTGKTDELKPDVQHTDAGHHSHTVMIRSLLAIIKVSGLSATEALEVRRTWARCLWTPTSSSSDDDTPHGAEIKRVPGMDWTLFHENLVSEITAFGIASCRGEYFMFHAAALANPRNGNALALVAPSGTGKTTATKILGTTLAYITDETAAISDNLSVLGYPKPLSLYGKSAVRPKHQHSPDELELLATEGDARLTCIAILDRVKDRDLDSAQAVELPLLEALERLIPESSSLSQLPRGLVSLCRLIDSLGGAQIFRYSEAEQLVPLVTSQLEQPRFPHDPKQDDWCEIPLEFSEERPDKAGLYRRVLVDDAVLISDSVAILKDQEFTTLRGLGPVLWQVLEQWTSLETLVKLLSAAFGDHPQAHSIVVENLNDLLERRLVEISLEDDL